jgi:hypothetical protein
MNTAGLPVLFLMFQEAIQIKEKADEVRRNDVAESVERDMY